MTKTLTTLLLIFAITELSANALADEYTGKGRINGHEFPVAVVRNPGDESAFIEMLRKRFGGTYEITRLPGGVFGYGSQFLVRPFTDRDLLTLPGRKDSAVIEQFVLAHSMTFSLLNINGELLAIGTPLSAFAKATPEPISADSEYKGLRQVIENAVEISFDFGNVTVSSLVGTLAAPTQEGKIALRAAFARDGLLPANSKEDAALLPSHELFSDGKSRFGNFILNKQPDSHEVQVNVNQVKVR